MKTIFAFLLLWSLSGCFGHRPSVQTGLEGKQLPDFDLLLMDSLTWLHTNSIPAGQPFVLLLFSPYCPYCRAQTDDIISDMKSLKDIRFFLLSSFPYRAIKTFYDHYQLKKYRNITVCQDKVGHVYKYFNVQSLPFIAVYSKGKLLKQVFIGKVSNDLIKETAFE